MVYSSYLIESDGLGSWSFGKDFSRNVIIFGVDNSLSSHTNNRINNALVLDEGPTYDINSSVSEAEKKFSINFSKAKFGLSLRYNGDNSYLFANVKIYNFKPSFHLNFS